MLISRAQWNCGSLRAVNLEVAKACLADGMSFDKRWELLRAMCGASAMSIREAARRVGRDVKAVHGDVTALLDAGVLRRTPAGEVEFPFEAVKVDFLLQAA